MNQLKIFALPAVIYTALLSLIPAWLTHVIYSVMSLTDGQGNVFVEAVVLIVGAFTGVIGAIHGYCLWFGYAWV